MQHDCVTDDWDDLTHPLNPAGVGWTQWLCPVCGEDGDDLELRRGRCPNCGAEVERESAPKSEVRSARGSRLKVLLPYTDGELGEIAKRKPAQAMLDERQR